MGPEKEPFMKLSLPEGREFESRRENSSLFRFLGKLAIYDHAFFVNEGEDNGFYIFSNNPNFEMMAQYMLENQYPAHLNLREVMDCDRDAHQKMIHNEVESEFENGVPDDWL